MFESLAMRNSRQAVVLDEALQAHGAARSVPNAYLEECAAQLVFAGDYAALVREAPRAELRYSENAYVSYFAHLDDPPETFERFLSAFGYVRDVDDFCVHRDAARARLEGIFRRYGISSQDLRRALRHEAIKKKTEEDLAYIYHHLDENRPSVVVRHDAEVVTALRHASTQQGAIPVLATWDGTLLRLCQRDDYSWWALDPASFLDLLAIVLGSPTESGTLSIEVALALEQQELQRAARIWDTIASIERRKFRDAELLQMAREFKDEFLKSQRAATAQRLKAEWVEFKKSRNR